MMNQKVTILLLIIILILFGICNICYATESGTIYLESSKNVIEQGEEIELSVCLKDATTAAFSFSLDFDSTKWEYTSKLDNVNVKDNHILYVWYDTKGGISGKQGELITLTFKAKEDGLTTFSIDGEFYNSSGQKMQISFQTKQVQIGKEEGVLQAQSEVGTDTNIENAILQSLRLDREGITPIFDSNTYEYYLTVPNDVKNIEVQAISQNPKATVTITGNTNLKEGLNTIQVEVISEDKKNTKTYTIHVTKTSELSLANTNLEILAIEHALLAPPFEASITKYSVEVSQQTEDLNIFAASEDENATVNITGGVNLQEGYNIVTIIVTAANGFSTKKYQVEVHRRNQEEQEKYQEEQNQQAEKLEEAYEIEKVNSRGNGQNAVEEEKQEKSNLTIFFIIVTIFILTVGGIALWYFKFYKKR